MRVHEHEVAGEVFQIRIIQALDSDPLVGGAIYTLSVDAREPAEDAVLRGFEVTVRFAPIFFALCDQQSRSSLQDTAARLVRGLLDRGRRSAAVVLVSSNGTAICDGQRIARLFV